MHSKKLPAMSVVGLSGPALLDCVPSSQHWKTPMVSDGPGPSLFFSCLQSFQKDALETVCVGKVSTSPNLLPGMKFEERCSNLAAESEECNSTVVGC